VRSACRSGCRGRSRWSCCCSATASTRDEVVDAAVELAERLAANGPLAVQASKRVARTTVADGEAAGWALNAELAAEVTGSADAAEASEAAAEKREPVWSGR
jgi:enoyl-CoA hydratase/carnithine racemase